MSKLKVGVAGAGVFGNYHAQKAAASARTEFMGVYDIDQARAEQVASTFGAPGMSDYRALRMKRLPVAVFFRSATRSASWHAPWGSCRLKRPRC